MTYSTAIFMVARLLMWIIIFVLPLIFFTLAASCEESDMGDISFFWLTGLLFYVGALCLAGYFGSTGQTPFIY